MGNTSLVELSFTKCKLDTFSRRTPHDAIVGQDLLVQGDLI